MKKTTNIRILAALLMASAAIASCSVKEDIFEGETTIEEEPAKVYTLSVNATKGGDDETTKALSLDGKTLNAAWAEGERVTVYNNTKKALLSGTLTAKSSGASTTLKGSLTGTIEDGDELILRFNSASYASQSGTLEYIAANCDYAEATVTVSGVDGENNVIPTSAASFVNKQAIVKFILKDQDGNPLNVSSLTISAESNRLVSAGGLRGTGDKTYYTEYTVDAGTGNNGVNGGYDQILDGNTATKWCVKTSTKSDGVWYVEFHTASAVQVDGYKLTTADDTQSYSGRNPKNWVLKAKANSSDAWTVIDTKTGNTDMPGANLSSVDFEADVQGGVYQYFRLEVSAVQSGDWFQLSEMQLYGCSDHAFSIQYGDVNVVPAAATNELTVALNNQNGAPDTYTLTATSGDVSYSFTKSGVTFESGKYYAITVKMTEAASPWDGSLAVEALTAGTVKVNINGTLSTGMNYSVNGGEKTLITTSTDIPVSAGDRVQFYGNGTSTQVYYKSDIKVKIQGSGTGFTCKAYGNIMSLLDETGFATKTDLPNENIFRELFRDNTTLTDAGDLLLPATTLRNYCYQDMFHGCSALTAAPALPATTLAGGCYYGMFQDCIALTTAPTLPAETLTSSCYYWMFQGCSALTAAPALPAMTLNAYCYGGMFQGCSALTAAPDLPAVTLTEGCYSYMFKDCTNLNFVRCLATSGITTPKTDQWLSGVAATGTFFRASGTEDQWTEG
ncbi:MAG: hypothetical protein J6M31_01600 [Bacteroidales bacterium]|nr:hypothetical protein [Bacteroidales bacterium]